MRIRKNAKILQFSAPSSSSPNTLIKKTHLNCVLNQSPWDIITFPPSPPNYSSDSSISPPLHFQVDEEDFGFAGNGSFVDSIGAIRSPGLMQACMGSEEMLDNDDKGPDFRAADAAGSRVGFGCIEVKEEEKIVEFEVEEIVLCRETDGKGWQCGKMVKDGHKMCARHLKSCSSTSTTSSKKLSDGTGARRGRGRPRINKKKEPAPTEDSNPFEYYYYSGFGPQWGKKKGPARTNGNGNGNGTGTDDQLGSSVAKNEDRSTTKTSVTKPDIDYMECDDDDDDDGEVGGESGKKRGRKRIKARSLKSLM